MCRSVRATPIPQSLSISDDTLKRGIPFSAQLNHDRRHFPDGIPFSDHDRVPLGLPNIRPYLPRLCPLRHPPAAHATAL